ncbi:hypothetical protein AMTRI_Chr03g47320 [Amborella trichopoda]|uniref:pentatricopeptide repeat-containing protein At5g66520-like n=1 Tax=Amborella trichopoda TaxID=13333 RepID=UPI0005D2D318|nr:pentatricopeptide repeat-containing protein At5g66520-like [Amborella trichopoda]|eukprot:XP_011622119.1 pentatricopeptide repeat-containing protein At5g66520-like [Amborella trichopoda]
MASVLSPLMTTPLSLSNQKSGVNSISEPNSKVHRNLLRQLESCSGVNQLKQIHSRCIVSGLYENPIVVSKLLAISASLMPNGLTYAHVLLTHFIDPNAFMYNTMIRAYTYSKNPREALFMFNEMVSRGKSPDAYTFPFVLRACSLLLAIDKGKEIHGFIVKLGLMSNVYVGGTLIDMYAKCNKIKYASKVFEKMPTKDVVSWAAMIGGYEKCKCFEEALRLFVRMRYQVLEAPNEASLVSAISACGLLGALERGKCIHSLLCKEGVSVILGNVLIDMYAKCGCIEEAIMVFHSLPVKDVFTWSGMVVGLAMNGLSDEAIAIFRHMQEVGQRPNGVTYVGVLTACAHVGYMDEGRFFFDSMRDYGLEPGIEHYGCMVDLFARAGYLNEAWLVLESMPMKPDPIMWGSLLGACRIHGNVSLGERIGKHVIDLDPLHGGRYVLLSNIYASAKRWADVEMVRGMMEERGVEKRPGWSMIEVRGVLHSFFVGDKRHPQTQEIYGMLEELNGLMREYIQKEGVR